MKGKKAATLANVAPAVLIIVLIGILLGIGMFVMTETQDALGSGNTVTIQEEQINVGSGQATVARATRCGFDNFAVINITNDTVSTLAIDTNNYTIDASDGTVVNITADPGVCPNAATCIWNISYTYTEADDGDAASDNYCDSITNTVTGLGNFATWMTVIVVVLAAAIVLGLVMSSFGRGTRI